VCEYILKVCERDILHIAWEFYQIYSLGLDGNIGSAVRFSGQKVKDRDQRW